MRCSLLSLGVALVLGAGQAPTPDNPIELGRVAWQRDLDSAREEARSAERPVLLLFQEVPG